MWLVLVRSSEGVLMKKFFAKNVSSGFRIILFIALITAFVLIVRNEIQKHGYSYTIYNGGSDVHE